MRSAFLCGCLVGIASAETLSGTLRYGYLFDKGQNRYYTARDSVITGVTITITGTYVTGGGIDLDGDSAADLTYVGPLDQRLSRVPHRLRGLFCQTMVSTLIAMIWPSLFQ
jgi:hypothetical protein